MSRPWPTGSGCWARTTPRPWDRGTISLPPTWRRVGPRRQSRCTSRPWLPANGCSARTLRPHPPYPLISRTNLALAYQAAGRYAEAIPLHEQALAALERVLGPDHPHTLQSRDNLAAAHREGADRVD